MNAEMKKSSPLFSLGQVVATPGALDLLDRTGTNASTLIYLHQTGDSGDLCAEDSQANRDAIAYGNRVLSSYTIGGEKVWVITESDRSCTTILLPSEY